MEKKSTRGVVTFHMKDVPFEGFPSEGIRGEIAIVRPKHCRNLEDCRSEGAMKLKEEIAQWLQLHFVQPGSGIATEYMDNIAASSVDGALWGKPLAPLNSTELNFIAHTISLALVLDDWVDNLKMASEDEGGQQKILSMFTKLLDTQSEDDDAVDEDLDFDLDVLGDQPMIGKIFGAMSELEDMGNSLVSNFRQEFRKKVGGVLLRWAKATEWGKTDTINNYSEFTARYHRLVDVGTRQVVESVALLDNICIPMQIQTHPMFQHLLALSDNIIVVLNDVLGFKKDAIKNETGGMVMYKVLKKGLSPQQAIEEEISLAKECLDDYMKLKPLVLARFQECPNVEAYIDIFEAVACSQVQCVITSPRFHMADANVQLKGV